MAWFLHRADNIRFLETDLSSFSRRPYLLPFRRGWLSSRVTTESCVTFCHSSCAGFPHQTGRLYQYKGRYGLFENGRIDS